VQTRDDEGKTRAGALDREPPPPAAQPQSEGQGFHGGLIELGQACPRRLDIRTGARQALSRNTLTASTREPFEGSEGT